MHDPFDLDDDFPTTAPATAASTEPFYLKGLNPPQREAVETLDGPVLMLAGAGTGKTRALTTRLAHILSTNHAFPGQVLLVTFTNKAAREMQERVGRIIGPAVEGMPWLGTFHSIAAKILRRHAEMIGLKSNFTILDTDDQIRLLKQILQADNIDDKRWPARLLAGLIDSWKNRGWTPEQVSSAHSAQYADGLGQKYYRAYQDRLKVLNACDFGDLLLHNITLFQKHSDVLNNYQQRFKYIMVDEYQDTNVAQYLWLRLLAQKHHNICCVGDDDQSIYGWRGAEVGNILRFEKDFPGAKVIRLEQNYRSHQHILSAASGLIATNQERLGKELWTDGDQGEKVQIRGVWDGEEEARTVAETIEAARRDGESPSEMAVLVRATSQMRSFEDRFLSIGLPYRVVGGPRFYERKEIRDALAYFRVIAQSADDLALERIINIPKRGLGDKTVQTVFNLARAQNISLHDAAVAIVETDEISKRARTSLAGLMDDFDRWRSALETMPHPELAEMVLEESGYTAMWMADKSPDSQGRLENLQELVRAMAEFDDLGGFLEHISLVMENDASQGEAKISLMTLHSAKGLEFDRVFLAGWEEGLFPNQRALDDGGQAALEEERRLAYVGLTRARKHAMILFAANRILYGKWQAALPSRFIEDLPQDHVELVTNRGLYGGSSQNWQRDRQWSPPRGGMRNDFRPPKQKRWGQIIDGKAERLSPTKKKSDFNVGDRAFHDKFGYGEVEEVDGDRLTINFEHSGRKRVLDSFVSKG
ncbi:MAG: UvrD-helicase domain-containing protein [Sphingomonadales bacterium]|jgi:DNA helicase-2/ATP-dependent DNA helicase PcrA